MEHPAGIYICRSLHIVAPGSIAAKYRTHTKLRGPKARLIPAWGVSPRFALKARFIAIIEEAGCPSSRRFYPSRRWKGTASAVP